MSMRSASVLAAIIGSGLVGAIISHAGPLDPPAGPVASTYKTLTEVEPRIAINATNTPGDADSLFKITTPGSYYLTGNITGVIGKHGIEIAASNVTLDLGGFALQGVPGMGNFDGVNITSTGFSGITLLNGTVSGWGKEGVDFGSVSINACRVTGVIARSNLSHGIFAGDNTEITSCVAQQNSGDGIRLSGTGTVTNCNANLNGGAGVLTGAGAVITGCTASQNLGPGITCSGHTTVSACSTIANSQGGIAAGTGSTVSGCNASSNTTFGIDATDGVIADCTARSNSGDGIRILGRCIVRGNTCSENGVGAGSGAGIHATGPDNRIEANNCLGADRGIDVDVGGNIIVRNTCSGNTNNWDVVAGNFILVVSASSAAAVTGNSGGTGLGSTDPNANFTY